MRESQTRRGFSFILPSEFRIPYSPLSQSPFSERAAGLEYNSFGAHTVDPACPQRGPVRGLFGAPP